MLGAFCVCSVHGGYFERADQVSDGEVATGLVAKGSSVPGSVYGSAKDVNSRSQAIWNMVDPIGTPATKSPTTVLQFDQRQRSRQVSYHLFATTFRERGSCAWSMINDLHCIGEQ